MSNTLALQVGGVAKDFKISRSFSLTETLNRTGQASFTVPSTVAVAPNDAIIFWNNSYNLDKCFAGYIREVKQKFYGLDYYENEVLCQDMNKLATAVKDGISFVPESADTERDALENICNGTGITVYTADESYCVDGETLVDYPDGNYFQCDNAGLYDAINELASMYSRIWWIDTAGYLHYKDPTSVGDAPFELSDDPNNTTTFPFLLLSYTTGDSNLYEWGSAYNIYHVGVLKTWTGTLHIGTVLKITSTLMGWTQEEFLITEVQTSLENGSPVFTVSFSDPAAVV